MATYDLVIELVIDKIYVRYASSSHKGYVGKLFSVPQTIQSTYQAKLSTKEIEKILPTHRSQAAVPKHVKKATREHSLAESRVCTKTIWLISNHGRIGRIK